ncbi:MAG: OsmC family protein [Candidatus Aenigmatarchaeota archaeon]
MMGTLAVELAKRKIPTPEERFVADVEGDIENVEGVLKITNIRVNYHLKVSKEKVEDAKEAFSKYITGCPAAQSLMGCINIEHNINIEEIS